MNKRTSQFNHFTSRKFASLSLVASNSIISQGLKESNSPSSSHVAPNSIISQVGSRPAGALCEIGFAVTKSPWSRSQAQDPLRSSAAHAPGRLLASRQRPSSDGSALHVGNSLFDYHGYYYCHPYCSSCYYFSPFLSSSSSSSNLRPPILFILIIIITLFYLHIPDITLTQGMILLYFIFRGNEWNSAVS